MDEPKTAAPWSPRASRFPLHVPLFYRARGQADWRLAETENVSRSGILFHSQERFEIGTEIEMGLVLVDVGAERAPQVVCHGCVVRTSPSTDERPRAAAAQILSYRFVGGIRDA